MYLTFALSNATGVQVGCGGSFGAGPTLQLTLLVLVGAEPAACTLVMFQREVRSHRTLDWILQQYYIVLNFRNILYIYIINCCKGK